MKNTRAPTKHWNITQWINIETGEILKKQEVKNYIKIKYEESYRQRDDIIEKTRTWHCKPKPQLRLFD